MPAYVIAELDTGEALTQTIARLDKRGVGKHGARMIAATSSIERLVGDWHPQHVVIMEFPSIEDARAWWAERQDSPPPQMKPVKRRMILLDGL